ncbi:hypothetical protein GOP47_0029132 [Adiantum capillus-veneris]|nr:hypothetical protein GOP47_0029132 [Adiantum capillus-veneris]
MDRVMWACVCVALLHASFVRSLLTGGAHATKFSTYNPAVPAHQNTDTSHGGGQKVWCVAKPAVDEMYLRGNIDYACGEGAIDCHSIQPGGPCYYPNSPIAHASYAMNLYYQKNGRNWWTCHFNDTGLVVFGDPSFGKCKYTAEW